MPKMKPKTVDEYINAAPNEAEEMLRELRTILKETAPDAEEKIKWGAAAFEDGRILFAFKAFNSHLNFIPTGPALEPFKEELKEFKISKDSFQISYNKPLPKDLIRRIAEYRVKDVKENDARWMY